jgi:microcystin-dependent protein
MSTNFQKLQAAINANTPAGTVVAFAGATAPTGWLLCDGSAVSRTQYPALFTAISVTYGIGDAVSTFNLPDLRAAGIRGVGASAKFTANTTVALGQVFDDQFQGWQVGVVNGSTYYGQPDTLGSKVSSTAAAGWATPSLHTSYQSATLGMKAVDNGVNGTPRTGPETTGKAIGMNYIIKY